MNSVDRVQAGAGIVAVAGEALVDVVPAPVAGYFEFAPGGSPANVAVGLARLGVPVRLLARLADDLLGRRLRAHLAANDVDLSYAVTAAEPSSLAIVEVAADGGASYDFRIDGTADWQWTPAELEGALARAPEGPVVAVHSGSLALTTEPGGAVLRALLAEASESATVSYDPNCRPLLMGDPGRVLGIVHELLASCDIVKISEEDLRWLLPGHSPTEVIEDWLGRGPALVAVTLGPAGAVAGTASGARTRRPGRPVTVIDTVGAGDSFSSALLAGLHRRGLLGANRRAELRALDLAILAELLDEAIAAAALTVTRRGANPPTLAELRSPA